MTDPPRLIDASDAPEELVQLVRSMRGPPPIPPNFSAQIHARAATRLAAWKVAGLAITTVAIGGAIMYAARPTPHADRAVTTRQIDHGPVMAPMQPLDPARQPLDPSPMEPIGQRPDRVAPPTVEPIAPPEPPAADSEPVAEPRPAAAAPSAQSGFLTIRTSPGARVLVDHQDTGRTTPMERLELGVGYHGIELRNPNGVVLSWREYVGPGEETIVDRADYTPRGAPHAPPIGAGEVVDPWANYSVGYLTLQSVPWAYISIDGASTGRVTPERGIQLTPGQHTIGLQTEDGATYSAVILIEGAETTHIFHRFEQNDVGTRPARVEAVHEEPVTIEPGIGVLAISSVPSARVRIDHRDMPAYTPARFHLPAGDYVIELELPNGTVVRLNTTVAAGQETRIFRNLEDRARTRPPRAAVEEAPPEAEAAPVSP